ncbi:hypothetical protein GPL17_06170 [Bradyrhizobium yuanmingense]|uniref:DNA/RNA non-specific endonuclease n=1 Tax=Bradyrhizobium yuanmingense TaxID=108015 RepID=UPI0012FC6247|nr:DNA/RNA non-specific endonuclease [Bradyrhizobium yuanmingense]MVT50073.1 hypothetical protein [Bradyrhizobium yuanmingense]
MAAPLDADTDFDNAILERAKEAALRWKARKSTRNKRTKAVDQNKLFEADTRSRLALRVNRLINDVRLASRDRRMPDNPALRSLVERTTPVVAEDLDADIVQEVVNGARDFLSIEFLERGLYAAKRVGRILIRSGGNVRARGTGFLIAPGLALTNQHVLRTSEMATACAIEMDYVQNRFGPVVQPQTFDLDPDTFFVNSKDFDFAIVAVAARSALGTALSDYGWLPLIDAQGKIAITPDDYLNIIQHPRGREKEVVIRENRLLDLATSEADEKELGPFLHYEADTEKGSSGSPVLNDQWEVVALHHSGVPKENESGQWLTLKGEIWKEGVNDVSEIAWIGNEGVRVSSLLAEFRKLPLDPIKRELLAPVLASQLPTADVDRIREFSNIPVRPPVRPAMERPREKAAKSNRTGRRPPVPSATIELPLRLTLSLGGRDAEIDLVRATYTPTRSSSADLLDEAIEPEEYADRDGYDRRFLGVNVPLPTIKERTRFGKLLRVPRPARRTDRFELRYHRFSILMNEIRRLAYVSACNVNFDPPASVSRDEGSQSWRRDPRIDPEHQVGGPYYEGNDYDKGHLTRRDDAAWGSNDDDALDANWDTFHYTNAAPQHELYNRSTDFTGRDLDLWGDLENFISKQGARQRTKLSIFNGPIFTADDKPLRDILVPRSYFKIVIWRDGTADPGAIGFVLEQDDLIGGLPEEAIEAGRFHMKQKRIRLIERKLDISFGVVGDWDRTPRGGAEEALDDTEIEIKSFSDIVGAAT